MLNIMQLHSGSLDCGPSEWSLLSLSCYILIVKLANVITIVYRQRVGGGYAAGFVFECWLLRYHNDLCSTVAGLSVQGFGRLFRLWGVLKETSLCWDHASPSHFSLFDSVGAGRDAHRRLCNYDIQALRKKIFIIRNPASPTWIYKTV